MRVMHRLFVAIRPPEDIRDLLIDAMDDSADFRWQDDEQLHLTLRFVGEVDRPLAEDLAAALGPLCTPPFELRDRRNRPLRAAQLRRVCGPASSRRRRSPPSPRRSSALCQSIGLEPERRAFHPHITLARWKGRRSREIAAFLDRTRGLASDPFPVESFSLFESRLSRHGAHYEEIASFPLVPTPSTDLQPLPLGPKSP